MLDTVIEQNIQEEVSRMFMAESLRECCNALNVAGKAVHNLTVMIDAQYFEEYFMDNPHPTLEEMISILHLWAEQELNDQEN